ncbi:MAG: L,D-transpeptidase [Beijerinckiaceae bacterium]|nr:L,D-transpeptidase [Beijerinckiaceae bacterium]
MARFTVFLLTAVSVAFLSTAAQALSADEVNAASWSPLEGFASKRPDPMIVKAQALLDRRGFSPGVVDGFDGDNFRKAVSIFRKVEGLGEGDALDEATWRALGGDAEAEVIVNYTVSAEDAAYEFAPGIPPDYAEQAKLKRLGYVSAQEMLAERFHMDTDLLAALNPGVALDVKGANVKVLAAQRPKPQQAMRLDADKRRGLLIVYGANDAVLASFPATIGSERTPTPTGELTVTRVARNPTYHYDPEKNFQQGSNKGRLTLPAGPNNPVGSTWIALSKPTFGIHGSPEPSKIGKTASHGCVRLTNWDAAWLVQMVKPGLIVRFID